MTCTQAAVFIAAYVVALILAILAGLRIGRWVADR